MRNHVNPIRNDLTLTHPQFCSTSRHPQYDNSNIIAYMLRIGHLSFDFPVVQAALSGYSDAPMRRVARRLGAPYAIHEVVLDQLVLQPGKIQKRLLALHPEDHPVAAQLMGAEPQQFANAAATMAQSGYDVIDINFGCPVKKVLGRCRGGFLLSQPNTAVQILKHVRDAVPKTIPVTLKMRRGIDHDPQSEKNFFHIFDAALSIGIDAITVHPRTVKQAYIGPANWDFLRHVKRAAGNHTILGSGDLFSPKDIKNMLEHTGVDGVTVARGCIGNPWIFNQTRQLLARKPTPPPPNVPEQGRVIRMHFNLAQACYDQKLVGRLMRKFGIKYAELHPHFQNVRAAFAAVRNASEWLAVLEHWYDPQRQWPPPRPKRHPDQHADAANAPAPT